MLFKLIKDVALILDDKQTISELNKYLNEEEYDASKFELIIMLTNFVIKDIASNFYCYRSTEYVETNENGEISFADLNYSVVKINEIKNSRNSKVKYNTDGTKIYGLDSSSVYTISYIYYPNDINSLSDTLVLPLGVNENAISCGVVYEYYLTKLQYAEARIWEEKYKEGLRNLYKPSKNLFCRGL